MVEYRKNDGRNDFVTRYVTDPEEAKKEPNIKKRVKKGEEIYNEHRKKNNPNVKEGR